MDHYQLSKKSICNIHLPNQKEQIYLDNIDYEVRIDFNLVDKKSLNYDTVSIPIRV